MKAFINNRFILIFTIIATLYVLGRQSDKYFGWTNVRNIKPDHVLTIHTDGAGYYAYLPKWFIYTDSKGFNFLKPITDKYKNPHFISGIRIDEHHPDGLDKYYVGTAILSSPIFLINHGINLLLYGKGDGYSKSYQLTVSFNALLFYLLGIIGLIKILRFFNLEYGVIALSVPLITFGTNLNFYTVYFPSFSHIYSFALIAWFFYFSLVFGSVLKRNYIVLLALLLGLIFLVRPTNILIVFILPFCFKSFKDFLIEVKNLCLNHKKVLLLSSLVVLLLVSFQFFVNFFQIGTFTLNTYSGESFSYLSNPKWKEVLFSFKKGYFIYAPIMFLSIPGLYCLFKYDRKLFFGWISIMIILTYVTSSWWCWWYGGGLGMRPFVEFLPILFLPIPFLLNYTNKFLFSFYLVFAFLGIYLFQVYQIQYNKNILHYDGVSKEQFNRIFLKTDDRFSWMLHFEEQRINSDYEKKDNYYLFKLDKWSNSNQTTSVLILDFETLDPKFTITNKKNRITKKAIAFRFQGKMLLTNQESNPSYEIIFFNEGKEIKKAYQYIGNRISKLNNWESFEKDFIPGIKVNEYDSIQFRLTKGYPLTYIKNIEVQQFLER